MEVLHLDKSLSPRKQIKNPPKRRTQNHHPLYVAQACNNISRQASTIHQNFSLPPPLPSSPPPPIEVQLMTHGHGGVFLNPHLPFSLSSSLPPNYHLHPALFPPQKNLQPPLLPLPAASKPIFLSLPPPSSRRLSLSPPTKDNTKKPSNRKPRKPHPKQHGVGSKTKGASPPSSQKDVVKSSAKGVLLEDINSVNNSKQAKVNEEIVLEELSGSVFSLSPPPSSLPLPKFSLRQPKLSCTLEAAAGEIDDGATDSICRMLRLR